MGKKKLAGEFPTEDELNKMGSRNRYYWKNRERVLKRQKKIDEKRDRRTRKIIYTAEEDNDGEVRYNSIEEMNEDFPGRPFGKMWSL